jgi:phosphatidylserine decarboxylase
MSRWVGRVSRWPLPVSVSNALVNGYCSAWGVDLDEADPTERPYGSFDALFTRHLRPGVRPIADDALVSPADGQLQISGTISAGSLRIKGNAYDVAELTGDPDGDRRFRDGSFAVIYLSPRDYHRVHAPVAGLATRVTGIPGDLFPVNSLGDRVPRLFCRNSRVAIHLETRDFGEVTVVLVGAMNVGRMGIAVLGGEEATAGTTALSPAKTLAKGDELGVFHLGSTVVVLCARSVAMVPPGRPIRYGESLLSAS